MDLVRFACSWFEAGRCWANNSYHRPIYFYTDDAAAASTTSSLVGRTDELVRTPTLLNACKLASRSGKHIYRPKLLVSSSSSSHASHQTHTHRSSSSSSLMSLTIDSVCSSIYLYMLFLLFSVRVHHSDCLSFVRITNFLDNPAQTLL